jgi:exodeoxyribonuclease V alpha subunit
LKHLGYSRSRLNALEELGIALEQDQDGNADYLSLLRKSERFAADSGIGCVAEKVLNGDSESSFAILQGKQGTYSDLQWKAEDRFQATLSEWIDTYYRPLACAESVERAFDALGQFRILTPIRIGSRGVEAINRTVSNKLNPDDAPFYKSQPIMVTRNQYELDLYNGDIGIVWPDNDGRLLAWFQCGKGLRPLALAKLAEYETVYAMTIHKTQGSEFRRVAIVLPEQAVRMLNRELIYTGITRAKSYLEICGDEEVWLTAIDQRAARHAGLAGKLDVPLFKSVDEPKENVIAHSDAS